MMNGGSPNARPGAELREGWGYSSRISDAPLVPPSMDWGQARPSLPRQHPQPAQEHDARQKDDAKPDGQNGKKGGAEPGDAEGEADETKPMPRWKKALYWTVGLLVLAALVVAGVLYYLHSQHFESTDDAFIDGNISQISTRVAGRVTQIAFEDNQTVKAGQLLLQLDPRDLQVQLDQAKAQRVQAAAQLDQARAQVGLQQANLDQASANARVSEADLGQSQADLARYRAVDPKAISRQQLDTAGATTRSANARLDASRQAIQAARAQVEAQRAAVEASQASLAQADVGVASAELQLSYARITAPAAGRVTKRTVELGNYVSPGQSLLAVVQDDLWVTANFKETQLADMRVGQEVRVRVDACPGQDLPAKVESFQAGSGSVFSALPAENATGNYVKVVQRLPVRLRFTDKGAAARCRLAPGMSTVPRVTVR